MPVVTMPDGTAVDMPDNPTAEQLGQLQQIQQGNGPAVETARVLDKSVRSGLAAFPGMIGDAALATMRNAPAMPGILGVGGMLQKLLDPQKTSAIYDTKFGDVKKTIETGGGLLPPVSEPVTEPGKAAGNIGESVVGAAAGGGPANLAQRVMIGLGGGTGGEVAARLTNDSPIARIIGSILGSGGTAAAQAYKPNATELVQQSTGQMRDSDWSKAKVLEAILDKLGLPNLKSQLLGPRSTLDDVVGQASSSPGGAREKLITGVQGTQKAVEEMINTKTLGNLPPNVGTRATALDDIQAAAQAKINTLKDNSNKAFVAAMPPETLEYPVAQTEGMYNQLVALAKSPKYGETSPQGQALLAFAEKLKNPAYKATLEAGDDPMAANQFITNAHQINNLIKGDNLRALKTEGFSGLPDKEIKSVIQAGTPEFDAARAAKSDVMLNQVNPVKKSLVGQIAEMGGGQQPDKVTARARAIDLTFNDGLKPQEILNLSKSIGGDEVGALLREHLSKTMQKVWPADTKRVEQTLNAPNSLVDALAGSNWQRQNINAALEAYAKANNVNPKDLQNGFYQITKALETYKDLKIAPGVSAGQTSQIAGKNLASTAAAPARSAFSFFQGKATAKTYDKIADMVLAPDGLKQLEALGKAPKPERLKAMALSILTQADEAQATVEK